MKRIGATRELLDLLRGDGVQLVEVLPASDYEDEHLPGVLSLPLRQLDRRSVSVLDRERPVVAYCFDYQ